MSVGCVYKDPASELFKLETWNYHERHYIMCFAIRYLKSRKISSYLVVREKNKSSSLGCI